MNKRSIGILLILFLFCSCNIVPKQTTSAEGMRRFFKWIKFEIVNNTDRSADIFLSGMTIKFDITNDIRMLDEVIYPSNDIMIVETDNIQKFEQTFNEMIEAGTSYKTGADSGNPNNPEDVEAMNYVSPLNQMYINGECKNVLFVKSCLPPNSRKPFYCQFQRHYWNQSAIESVYIDLTAGTKKYALFGWEISEYTIDVSNDVYPLYNLDIWADNKNPNKKYSKKTEDTQSQSLACHYLEETITINGDSTSDIVVTKNCISFPNDEP